MALYLRGGLGPLRVSTRVAGTREVKGLFTGFAKVLGPTVIGVLVAMALLASFISWVTGIDAEIIMTIEGWILFGGIGAAALAAAVLTVLWIRVSLQTLPRGSERREVKVYAWFFATCATALAVGGLSAVVSSVFDVDQGAVALAMVRTLCAALVIYWIFLLVRWVRRKAVSRASSPGENAVQGL